MTKDEKVRELSSIIYSKCGVQIRNCDSETIADKLVELNYGDIKQTALDFYTAATLALADGITEYEKDGKKVFAISAEDMQEYLDEKAKSYGVRTIK